MRLGRGEGARGRAGEPAATEAEGAGAGSVAVGRHRLSGAPPSAAGYPALALRRQGFLQ